MKKITTLIGLLFGLFLSLSINAQTTCEVENLYDPVNNDVANLNLGQSFVACQTGTLKSIAVLIGFGQANTGETINFYDGASTAAANL